MKGQNWIHIQIKWLYYKYRLKMKRLLTPKLPRIKIQLYQDGENLLNNMTNQSS